MSGQAPCSVPRPLPSELFSGCWQAFFSFTVWAEASVLRHFLSKLFGKHQDSCLPSCGLGRRKSDRHVSAINGYSD